MNAESIELVERAQSNDPAAFAQLVAVYRQMCLSVAFRVLRDATAANDVSQDAFIKAWMRLSDLREPRRFGTWLCGIARNLAVDRLRRRRRAETLGSDTLPAKTGRWTVDPIDDVCRRECHEMVNGAMQGLDEVARTALTLRYYDKMPSKQIAQQLGISADAVDMRLIRARKRLRAALSNITAA